MEVLTWQTYTSKAPPKKYIFCLLELDGAGRMDKLSVGRSHYAKKDVAAKWRDKIALEIHPDVCSHPLAKKAMAELNNMYREMIK